MEEPFVGILAQNAGERRWGRDAGRAQCDVGKLRWGAERARLGAELLGDEAEHTRALGLIEALALMAPAAEFELTMHDVSFVAGSAILPLRARHRRPVV